MADWNPDPVVLEEIIHELESIKNRDTPSFVIKRVDGDHRYTPNQLISEVREGTALGQKLYALHVELKENEK